MQLPADFFRNLALSPDVRSNRIHRPADLQVLEGQAIQPHEVVDMDPGEPLPAITERTAGEDAEGEREQSKSQGAATEDERGANQHDAQTERLGFKGGSLPLLARPSQFAHPLAFRGTRIPPDEANARLRRSAFRTSTQSDDLVPVGCQAGRQVPPYVARSTGDQDFHPYYYARPEAPTWRSGGDLSTRRARPACRRAGGGSGLEAAHAPFRTRLLEAMERLRQQCGPVVLATLA